MNVFITYCPATENVQCCDISETLNIFAQNKQCVSFFVVLVIFFLFVTYIVSSHDEKIQVHTSLSTSHSVLSFFVEKHFFIPVVLLSCLLNTEIQTETTVGRAADLFIGLNNTVPIMGNLKTATHQKLK
jgi:hypothetical protein